MAVLVTFLLLGQNTQYPQVKGFFGSQFVEVSVCSHLAPRQDGMAEVITEETQFVSRKTEPSFLVSLFIGDSLLLGVSHTQSGTDFPLE